MQRKAVLTALGLALLGQIAAAQVVEYYHLDAIGNVRVVADSSGNVLEQHDYLPFGEECATGPCSSNAGVAGGQTRKFTGKERDQETGYDYFGARYYAARTGRFATIDPVYTWQENLEDPQRWNRYASVRNNPLRYTDPDGKFFVPLIIAGAVLYAILTSPDIANAPGPQDPTFRSDQTGKLILNAAIGTAVARGIVGAEVAKVPDESDLLGRAREARDARAADLGPKKPPQRPAAVAAGYNRDTGEVATGCSGGGVCGEKRVVEALGGDPSRVGFAETVRPRPGGPPFKPVPVCERCEGDYGRPAFPKGTEFKTDKQQ